MKTMEIRFLLPFALPVALVVIHAVLTPGSLVWTGALIIGLLLAYGAVCMIFRHMASRRMAELRQANERLESALVERRRSEEALQEGERVFRLIVDNATDMISRHRPDSTIIYVTPSCERMLGYRPGDMVGHKADKFVVPGDMDAVWAAVRKAQDAGEDRYRAEFRMVRRDGTFMWAETLGWFIRDGQGQVVETHSTMRDITERRRMEAALRESEERYRLLFEEAIEGIFRTTPDGGVLMINTSMARMLGYASVQDVMERVTDIGVQVYADPEERKGLIARLMREGTVTGSEMLFRKTDGSSMKAMLNFRLVKDRAGHPLHIEGSCVDITAKWLAEEALRASEAKYRRLYDTMRDAFVTVDLEGRIREYNRAFLAMTGYDAEEVGGLTYRDITPVKWHVFEAKILEKETLQRGYSDIYEKEYRRKDGSVLPVELRTYLLSDDDGNPAGMWAIVRDISDRRQAEERLREVNARLETIIEFLPDATLITDTEGRIIAWNRAIEEMTGVPKAEMLGKDHCEAMVSFYGEPGPYLIDFIHSDDREILSRYTNIRRRRETLDAEVFTPALYQGRGACIWAIAAPLYDRDGNVMGAIESIRDITDRRQAEEELRRSEAKYRDIFEDAVVGIYQSTLEGRYITVNPAFARIFGYGSPEEMVADVMDIGGQLYADPDERNRFKAFLERDERFEGFEVQVVRRDGSTRWVFMNAHNVRDPDGTLLYYEGTCVDITGRKQAEEALEESEERYRLLAENATDIIFTMDTNLRLTYVSPSVMRMRGFTVEDAMAQTPEDALTPASLEAASRAFLEELEIEAQESKDLSRTRTLELEERCKDGSTIWTETTFTLLRDADAKLTGFLGITRDITDRRQAAEERKRLETQLSQAQKMESIGTLAGGIAHDFNNILSAIIGYTELAVDDLSDPDKVRRELGEVIKAGDRAKDLVGQILTFSRKAETVYSPIALRTIVKESLRMLRSVTPATVDIRQELADSGLIMSNPTQIHQIVMNLCTNAAHAMDPLGGVIDVGLRRVSLDEGAAAGLDVAPGSYLRLTVSDTGPGIPPEIMDRIFDPYFTTKEMGRGTGLGLSVVHGIVKSHHGAVTCRSVPGEGTLFDVYLPEIEAERKPVKSAAKEPMPTGTERILFVDDEAALAGLAEKMLRKLGYTVTSRTSSVEALEVFTETPDAFDVVITDMTMPAMTGDSLARRIMEVRPNIPVILCTGHSEHITEERARNMGIRAFLLKPVEMGVLAATVRRVLDAG